MLAVRRFSLLLVTPLLSACAGGTLLGFEIGDIGGLWTASAYEFVSNTTSTDRVDIIDRDGAFFTLSVDDGVQPPVVGSTLDDGTGSRTNRSGTVDIKDGLITLGEDSFAVIHDGNRMTLTNEDGVFDFGSGTVSVTVVITLDRL
ncbi:MAG: hypothetical protein ACPHQP_00985 [Longimicrobiales bacterium]